MAVECNIVKDCGVISTHSNGSTMELKLIEWGGNEARYDIRTWSKGYALGGITMTRDDLNKLGELIKIIKPSKKIVTNGDKVLESSIKENAKITPMPTKESAKSKTESATSKSNIIQFPKQRPEIEKMVTEGNASYEDCKRKISIYLKTYADADSQYVLNGILELCHVDADFRNNVMREDKTYADALKYMKKMCQEGYGYKYGDIGVVDKDLGLGMTIDYFNLDPEKLAPKTAKVEIPKTAATSKRGRKKKEA